MGGRAILLVVVLGGCAGSGAGDDGPTDACAGGAPGCTDADCGLTCGGELYACDGGEWQRVGYCEWCLGGAGADDARWTWEQAVELAGCPAQVVPRAEVAAILTRGAAAEGYADVVFDDPAVAATASSAIFSMGYGTCTDAVALEVTDVWRVDGAAAPVTISYAIDATGPGRLAAATTLGGTLHAAVGGCELDGTLAGTWSPP